MPESTSANLEIRRVDPRRRRRLWITFGAAGLLIAGMAFWAGYQVGDRAAPERQRFRQLMTELQKAYGDNTRMRDRVAALERSEQVARNANRSLRDEIAELQETLAGVRSDLSLYQGLASAAGDMEEGLGVHQLVIQPLRAPHVFEFTLTLMQDLEGAEPVSGRAWIVLEGSRNGDPERLGLAALGAAEEDFLPFSLKYFRLLGGTLTLPEGFEPARVVVRLRAGNGENETVEADFDWSAVVKRTARPTTETGAPGS